MKRAQNWIVYLFILFLFFLITFSIFRLVLFFNNNPNSYTGSNISNSFYLGISFDIMVSSYLLIIPALLFIITMFTNTLSKWIIGIITAYLTIIFAVILLSCIADVPCYLYTGARLNSSLLMWTDTPNEMIGFIIDNKAYHFWLIIFFSSTVISIFLMLFLKKRIIDSSAGYNASMRAKIVSILFVVFLLLIGIRGGFYARPIAIKDAFVSDEPFANMLALNPLHTFFDSMEKTSINFLDNQLALQNVKKYLQSNNNEHFPISRNTIFQDSAIKPNIILILMESFTAEVTGLSKSGISYTPVLDSVAKNGISFSNFYTSGIHTCNGIYGVLYSLPSVPGVHPLSNIFTANQKFYGMPEVLKENGYSTNFFCTHYKEFDNMGYFLRNNGFDNFFSVQDYDPNSSEGIFGVSDETQYAFAFNKLNEMSNSGKPFFASLLTISTHEPPVLPTKTSFIPKSKIPFEQVYEYADWALGKFMKQCSQQAWFDNTIFLFVADHGCNMSDKYDIPLSYHHSPFIIYSPELIKGVKEIDKLAVQMDVFPTVMNFLKIDYNNNTMGINLLEEERPFAFFCKDHLIGCLNKQYFFIVQKFGGEALYDYSIRSSKNIIGEKTLLADSMKTYVYSMFQTSQWLLENKKLGKP